MPVIKSAKKKLRQDKKRQERNKVVKDLLKKVVKTFRANPTDVNLQAVYKTADKAAKNHLIHKNKAARLKSSLAKSMQNDATAKPAVKTSPTKAAALKKKATKKVTSKKTK